LYRRFQSYDVVRPEMNIAKHRRLSFNPDKGV
jgi:hypothetical protein